jgi:endonuclease/exonuclease/phosphatase family metal-dependent hydrolase
MRLVSYNVRYFGHGLKGLASTATSKRRIAGALASMGVAPGGLPDLVALQEVETRSLRSGVAHRGAHPVETQLEAFLRHLGAEFAHQGLKQPYQAWYFPAHVYSVGRVRLYTTGLAVLVNSQTLHVTTHNGQAPYAITHHRSARLKRVKQTRIAAHLELETTHARRFHLFNTHLSLPTPWAREFWSQKGKMGFGVNQLEEARAVCAYAKHTAGDAPYVLVGDFNSAPATPVYQLVTGELGLTGAQEQLAQIDAKRADGFATAGFMAMRMHLDHVFGHGVRFTDLEGTRAFGDARSPFHGLSDHVPLIARFEA